MSEIEHIVKLKLEQQRKMLDKFIKAKNATAQRDCKLMIHLLEEILEDAEANELESSANDLHKHIVNGSAYDKCDDCGESNDTVFCRPDGGGKLCYNCYSENVELDTDYDF